jgi:hypothetical protein
MKDFSYGMKRLLQLWWTQCEAIFREADTHEEGPIMVVGRVLVGLYDVAVMLEDEL